MLSERTHAPFQALQSSVGVFRCMKIDGPLQLQPLVMDQFIYLFIYLSSYPPSKSKEKDIKKKKTHLKINKQCRWTQTQ